jgi:hypothetical protein
MSDILRFNFVFQEKTHCMQVAAEKSTGKLMLRCYGFFGMEDTVPDFRWDYIMEEGDWDKLMMIIEDANAAKWEAAYVDDSEEDGAVWSLEIHVLGRHTITEGYNRFPREFESFKRDMIDFMRMKRRQLEPGIPDFRNFTVVEQKGERCPIVIADYMERTFTFYNLFDRYDQDGTYFMQDGDWESLQEIFLKYDIFSRFREAPGPAVKDVDSQDSVSVGYKPGQITLRFTGYDPEWWPGFSSDIFGRIKDMFSEGRKPADQNINAPSE